jgi:hypothetical protein
MAAIARIDSHDSNLCRASSDALDNDHLPHVSHSKPVSTPILDDAAEIEAALYSPSVTAKIWGVASGQLGNVSRYPFTPSIASALTRLPGLPPDAIPEYTLPGGNEYVYTAASFWTSGFFPGSIYLLYERRAKWPQVINVSDQSALQPDLTKLQSAARWWSQNLHAQAHLTDTHDLGFLIFPWARLGWELDGSEDCYRSMLVAAHGLAARFDPRVGCIRSWDTCFTKRYAFADPKEDFLVIIDNMMSSFTSLSCLAKHRTSSLAADLLLSSSSRPGVDVLRRRPHQRHPPSRNRNQTRAQDAGVPHRVRQ